jgi:hypothetical protein
MPYRSNEEETQITELPQPVTPTKPSDNDGAGHDNSDAERAVTQSNDDAELGREKKRQANDCDA